MRAIKKPEFVFGLVIVALGFVLRAHQLGASSLWHDEAFTWFFTRLPWMEMLDNVRLDGVNPPVYYLGTKIFVDVFGDGESVLRLLSLIAGVGSVYFSWLLGKEAGGKVGGLASAAFMAFHPMAIHYSRDARPYGLVLMLAVLLLYYYLRLRKERSPKLWIAAFAALMFGQMSHYFFFVLGGVILLMVIVEIRKDPLFFRYWVIVWIAAFLPLAGWLGWYFSQPTPSLGIGWIQRPEIMDIFGTWWNLLSGYGGIFSLPTTIFGLVSLGLVASSVLLANKQNENLRFLFLGLVISVIVVWALSQRRPVYVDRYFIVFLPVVAYLIAKGAQAVMQRLQEGYEGIFSKRWIAVSVPVILILVGTWTGWQVHVDEKYGREDWRGLVSYYDQQDGLNSETWLSEPEASIPMQYYLRGDLSNAVASLEPYLCETPCWWVLRQPYSATHAFSQGISLLGRPPFPDVPQYCKVLDEWESASGIALWQIVCEDES